MHGTRWELLVAVNRRERGTNLQHMRLCLTTGHGKHYIDVIMSAMASQITGVSIGCTAVCSGLDHRNHQSSALLAFVRGIHRRHMDSSLKGPVTLQMFPFDEIGTNLDWILVWFSFHWTDSRFRPAPYFFTNCEFSKPSHTFITSVSFQSQHG